MILALWCAVAYLIGSIPSGYVIGKVFYHVDLRKIGSGNIGATNAYRILGIKAGLSVFLCDFFKGVFVVWLGEPDVLTALLCAFFVIVGNDWSVFLHFKSGRGVACGIGAFTYICPPAALAAFLVWLVVFFFSRIVSLSSIIAAPFVPIVMFFLGKPIEYTAFAAVAALVVIGKHKDNIGRLLRGEEKKISHEKR